MILNKLLIKFNIIKTHEKDLYLKNKINFLNNYILVLMGIGDWGLGIGDLGIGDWAQSPIPNPQSPIPILYK